MCHSATSESETLLGKNTVAQLQPGARVLNIGLGCGITAGTLAASVNVAALEIVEINPAVARVTRELFGQYNGHVLDLEKTRLVIEDGAAFLRDTPRTYDAVVIDIEEPTVVHSSILYTREYFELIRRKLSPHGVLALWMISMQPASGKIVWNTLRAVFSNVDQRAAETAPNFSFYASMRPLHLPPPDSADARMARDMKAIALDELNTVDNRALERYFDIRQAFSLPSDYDEPAFVDVERARAERQGATSQGQAR
jgi:spermidine synthase